MLLAYGGSAQGGRFVPNAYQPLPPCTAAHALPVFLPASASAASMLVTANTPRGGGGGGGGALALGAGDAAPGVAATGALPRSLQRALASHPPPSASAADAFVLAQVKAVLGLSEDQNNFSGGASNDYSSGYNLGEGAGGSFDSNAGKLLRTAGMNATAQQQQHQQHQMTSTPRRPIAHSPSITSLTPSNNTAAAIYPPAKNNTGDGNSANGVSLYFSSADPHAPVTITGPASSSSSGSSAAAGSVSATAAAVAVARGGGVITVDSLAHRLSAGTYRALVDENARLAEAVRQADAVSGDLLYNAAALTELAAQHDAEAQRLLRALEATGAEKALVQGEVTGLRTLMGKMRSERAQVLSQLATVCGKLGVATERVSHLQSRTDAVEDELESTRIALKSESDKAAQHRQEAAALREERKRRHIELEKLELDRAALAQLRAKFEAAHADWERRERAWGEGRDMLSSQLAARRQRQLASDAELKVVREEKGALAADLARATQRGAELSLALDSTKRDLKVSREETEETAKKLSRAEQLLAEERARALAAEEAHAGAAAGAKDGDARRLAIEAELNMLKQQLRTETEERRNAQQQHLSLKRDYDKTVKTQSKAGEEYLALLRQYEALKERHLTTAKELAVAARKVRDMEAQADAGAELQLAFTQAQSDVQRLMLRLHDLKTSSEAQIIALTDARDRLGQQVDLLRSKGASASAAAEEQRTELRRLKRVEGDLEGIMSAVTVERDAARREAAAARAQLTEAGDHTAAVVEALEATVAELRAELKRAQAGGGNRRGTVNSSAGDDDATAAAAAAAGAAAVAEAEAAAEEGAVRGSLRGTRGTLVSRRFLSTLKNVQTGESAANNNNGASAGDAHGGQQTPGSPVPGAHSLSASSGGGGGGGGGARSSVDAAAASAAATAAAAAAALSQAQAEAQMLRAMLASLEDEKLLRQQELADTRAQANETQQRLTATMMAMQRKVAELEHELSKEREGRLGNDIY